MAAVAARVAKRHSNFPRSILASWKRFSTSDDGNQGGFTVLCNSKNGAEVYLLGTCHVSHRRAQEASELIKIVHPNVVALELCKKRARGIMENRKPLGLEDFPRLPGDLGQKTLTLAAQHLEDVMRSTGIHPGEEFKECLAAIEEGWRVGARIACIDADFHATMGKVRNALSMNQVFSFLADLRELPRKYPNYFESVMVDDPQDRIEAMLKPISMKEALELYTAYFPDAVRTKILLHERNELMVKHLRNFEGKIVAVVGMLHVDGIKKLWQEAEQ